MSGAFSRPRHGDQLGTGSLLRNGGDRSFQIRRDQFGVFLENFDDLIDGRSIFRDEFPALRQKLAQIFGNGFRETELVTLLDVFDHLAV